MLLPDKRNHHRPGLRAALKGARETYRHYSGADSDAAHENGTRSEPEPETEQAEEVSEAPLPARVEPDHGGPGDRRRQAGRWLRQRPGPLSARQEKRSLPEPPRQGDPDVVLDVQRLHVDEIELKLDDLKAHVALEAQVLDLLRLDVGVDASLRGVDLSIKGVDAQALLKVRLENLTVILDRVMNTVDRNPELLARLADRIGATLGEVGSSAAQAVGGLGEDAGAVAGQLAESAASAVEDVGGVARVVTPGEPDRVGPSGAGAR